MHRGNQNFAIIWSAYSTPLYAGCKPFGFKMSAKLEILQIVDHFILLTTLESFGIPIAKLRRNVNFRVQQPCF
jgi:hypothetical protein